MRVQFWSLVVSGVGIASVTVSARGEIVQQTNWIAYWPMVAAVVTWAFLAGGVLARLTGVKDSLSKEIADEKTERQKLEQRLSTVEATAVKRDKLDDKLENINTKIDALHEKIALLVGSKDWRGNLHGSEE